MKELIWKLLAYVVSWPTVANWLIERAQRTPYTHLDGYMDRWWLFNRYDTSDKENRLLPSVRVHHILRPDRGRDLHDHPWDARTIILKGGYVETRRGPAGEIVKYTRKPGDTATLKFEEYHRIDRMLSPEQGTWSIFVTWRYRGTWGFLVNGRKVPHRLYEGPPP